MSVWTKFKQPVDDKALIEACLAQGLYLNVAHEFLRDYQGLRFGFASLNEAEQTEAIAIMANVLSSLTSL